MKAISFLFPHSEEIELKNTVKLDSSWRIRERASTLLLLAQGLSCVKVSVKIELSRTTVETTRRNGFLDKSQSILDRPR